MSDIDEASVGAVEAAEASRNRGIYLLPNLFTTAALFSGFYAVVAAMQNNFHIVGPAIFVAMLMDGLDGRVARLTNTQTPFGAEYDSLSDMVSFGVAPALIVYSFALHSLGKVGWLVSFLFAVCGALRLARFNTGSVQVTRRYFQGLPIPAAAGVLVGCVWLCHQYALTLTFMHSCAFAFITLAAAMLMVSNIPYRSFKDIEVKGKVPFRIILMMVGIFTFVAIDPPEVLTGGFVLFAVSGPLLALWKLLFARRVFKRGG